MGQEEDGTVTVRVGGVPGERVPWEQRKEHTGCRPGDSLTVRFGDGISRVLLEEVMGVGGVNALLWEGFRENGRNRGDDIEYGHSL